MIVWVTLDKVKEFDPHHRFSSFKKIREKNLILSWLKVVATQHDLSQYTSCIFF